MIRPIRRYGHLLYWVPSETVPGLDYLVDLDNDEYKLGRCNCPDFEIRIMAPIEHDDRPEKWTCKHIERARKELTSEGDTVEGRK